MINLIWPLLFLGVSVYELFKFLPRLAKGFGVVLHRYEVLIVIPKKANAWQKFALLLWILVWTITSLFSLAFLYFVYTGDIKL